MASHMDSINRATFTLGVFVALAAAAAVSATLAGQQPRIPSPTRPHADTAPPAVLTRPDLEAWLDGFVPYALQQGDIAGLAISVVKDGAVLLEKGYGYADVAKKIPMDPRHTIVPVASVSKAFTGTAVMQLVERGRLDLDRDVNQYLDFEIPATFARPITLRHLLTHTAGFEETGYRRYSPPLSLRDHVLMVPDRIYPPGVVPAYSNYGLNLAGYIVERVSGENFTNYVQRHLLEPLGMARSTFRPTLPADLQPFEAKTYALASGEPYPPNLVVELAPVDFPAAGLATSAHDMTRFMLAHLEQLEGGGQLLRPETVALMHAPAFVPIPGAQPIALGLFRADRNGHRVIGHSGDGEGAHALMNLLPDEKIGVFIAMNSDGSVEDLFPAAFAVRAMLFERFVDRYFPASIAPELPTTTTAAQHARLAAGEYLWSRQQKGDFQEALGLVSRFLGLKPYIRSNADGTIVTAPSLTFEPSGRDQTWREVDSFVWQEVGGRARLVMGVADDAVKSVWSNASPSFLIGLRVPTIWSARLNVPLLGLAGLTLVLAVLLPPVAAAIRRHYGAQLELPLAERSALRLSRIAVAIGVLYLFGWVIVLIGDLASRVGSEPWIRLVQALGLLCIPAAGVAAWNAWLTWRSKRGLWAKVSRSATAISLGYLVWFSFAFHLISARID